MRLAVVICFASMTMMSQVPIGQPVASTLPGQDPLTMVGLAYCLIPDQLSYPNGQAITTWQGIGITLTNSNTGPLKGVGQRGIAGAQFFGTNFLRSTTSLDSLLRTNCTFFAVVEATNRTQTVKTFVSLGNMEIQYDANAVGSGSSREGMAFSFSSAWVDDDRKPGVGHAYINNQIITPWAVTMFWDNSATMVNKMEVGINFVMRPCLVPVDGTLPNIAGAVVLGQEPGGSRQFTGLINAIYIFTNTLTRAQIRSVQSWLISKYCFPAPSRFIHDGDRISIGGDMGSEEKDYYPWPHQLKYGFGTNNTTAGTMASSARSLADVVAYANGSGPGEAHPSYRDNLYIASAGSLEMDEGTNAVTLYGYYSDLENRMRLAGHKTVACTIISRNATNASFDGQRLIFNDMVRTNYKLFADVIFDFASLTHFTNAADASDSTYYIQAGGTCPSLRGANLLSKYAWEQLGKARILSTNMMAQ